MSEIQITENENKMGVENITSLIIKMSLPAMLSMLVQALYNIVDSMFVAFYSKDGLAAISYAFPAHMLLNAVAIGTGVGANSLISRLLGAKLKKRADSAASISIMLSLISSIVFAIIGLLFSNIYMKFFTQNQQIINMGTQYMLILFVFSIGAFIGGTCPKILQATGDMINPMTTQLVGAVTNIILDPIMIFGLFGFPKMGIAGAAIATVIGQCVAAAMAFYILIKKTDILNVTFKHFKFNKEIIKDIYIVALPSMAMQAIGSVLISFLNKILASHSDTAVSVLGVYYKLQSFVFMPIFGLSQGAMPIIGYNYGAKESIRMKDAMKISFIIAIVIMAAGTLAFWLFPIPLLKLFDADQEMISIGVAALKIISLSFILAAVNIVISTFFQAIGQGVKSMIISLLRQLLFILPIAYILFKISGLTAFWFSFPIAELAALIMSIVWYIKTFDETQKSFIKESVEK